MDGMRQLQGDGVIRHVGVSNYSLDRWKRAERALGAPVVSNQVEYSLAERSPDRDLVPFAATNDRLMIAYSPLAQGFLAAKYDASNRPGGVRPTNPLFLEENLTRGHELLDTLRSVAKTHDATPAQVALAWVIRRPNVVAIPGASSVDQLERNAAAADLDLTDSEDARLTDASDRFKPLRPPRRRPWSARDCSPPPTGRDHGVNRAGAVGTGTAGLRAAPDVTGSAGPSGSACTRTVGAGRRRTYGASAARRACAAPRPPSGHPLIAGITPLLRVRDRRIAAGASQRPKSDSGRRFRACAPASRARQ